MWTSNSQITFSCVFGVGGNLGHSTAFTIRSIFPLLLTHLRNPRHVSERQHWLADIWSFKRGWYQPRILANLYIGLIKVCSHLRLSQLDSSSQSRAASKSARRNKQSRIMVWVMKVEVILFSVSFHVVICLETHWLSHFLAKWETRWWTKTLADCGRHFVCAFHLVHRAVLHFAYFCSALPPSLVFINVTAVWLSTNCPFCVCVCVCVCVVAIYRRGGVRVFQQRFCNANEH